jgi:hypothetical protein
MTGPRAKSGAVDGIALPGESKAGSFLRGIRKVFDN